MKQEIKKRIYFNEYNFLMGQTTYLPLVSGLLQAYAEKTPDLRNHYDFMPFLFHVDLPEKIISQIDNPFIATFSVMMWNEQLSLQVAKEIKDKFPNCIIIFGGAQPPHRPIDYFKKYPFIDITVRGQGEETFSKILTALVDKSDLREIPSMSWRDPVSGECIVNEEELIFNNDLDRFPSPYLKGLYDDLIKSRKDLNFQAILETNRGCPFMCTFCYWGMGGLRRKYSYFGIDRVAKELAWMGDHKIRYVFNADSNFGMHARDFEITESIIQTKKKYGYPEKFRTCYGKNTDAKIYKISRMMYENGLEKGITLSRQSNDDQVLINIKRGNIKISTYEHLQRQFNDENIPVYSELILGLPGETYATWVSGIEHMLSAGLKNQLFAYICQVYPNTDLGDPKYQKDFGIITKRIELNEIHASLRNERLVTEFEDIIISSQSMPLEDWKKMLVFSTTTMLIHSLKIGFYLAFYMVDRFNIKYTDLITFLAELKMPKAISPMLAAEIEEFHNYPERLLEGQGRGVRLERYGKIYWDVEEASFFRITENLDVFYQELYDVACFYLDEKKISYDPLELREAVEYQKAVIPKLGLSSATDYNFNWNFPEYFEKRVSSNPIPLIKEPQGMRVFPNDCKDDLIDFAKQTILWGRKSGRTLLKVEILKDQEVLIS